MEDNKTLGEVIAKEFENIYKQGCKDTAEKIISEIKQIPVIRKGKTLFIKVEDFSHKINEIATREGIEIKE